MQREKHLDTAVLVYLFVILTFITINIINSVSICDLVYLVVVVCCVLKYFIIVHDCRK